MFNKKILRSAALSCLLVSFAGANDKFTLDEMLVEVIQKNPYIQEKLHQYESIVHEVDMSKSGYLPTLDLTAKSGRKNVRKWSDPSEKDVYNESEVSLKLVQNIFNGYGTEHATQRDIERTKAAYYKYVEVTQDKMKEATRAYIDYIKYYNMFLVTQSNVKIHEKIQQKIQERFDRGYGRKSEIERVKGRLSLAISNNVSAKSNFLDSKIKFEKALGRSVEVASLVMPEFKYQLPKTLDDAMKKAVENNPSIIVSNHDIEIAKENIGYTKRNNYPKIDLELEASRFNNKNASTDDNERDYSAMLVMNYNLYNGGNDVAEQTKYKKLLNYEYAHKNKLLSDLKESLDLSWNSYTMLNEQLKYQKDYQSYTQTSKDAYFEEFQLGRRSLIDLLDIQDELNSIKMQLINNQYDILSSKYRIIDSTGELYQDFAKNINDNLSNKKYID